MPFASFSLRQKVIAVISGFVALRFALVAFVGLSIDESYALAIGREWHLSYFDHPPLHFWLAHSAEYIFGNSRAARIPFILLGGGSSWLLFLLTSRLFDERAGLWAVLAFNLSAFFSIIASGWISPDGPLNFALLAAALCAQKVLIRENPDLSLRHWLLVGFWFGVAALAKYHAALVGLGLFLFVATSPRLRTVLRSPAPYAAIILACFIFSPVIVWNATHDWASFAFQSGRAAVSGKLHIGHFYSQFTGEIGFLFPWIFVPLVLATWAALKQSNDERYRFCILMGLPGVLFFTLAPLWGRAGMPYWPMPGWLLLLPLLGQFLAERAQPHRWPARWLAASAVCFAIFVGLGASDAATGWLGAEFPQTFKTDPTLESLEWTQLRTALTERNLLGRQNTFIVSSSWRDAAKTDAALSGQMPVYVLCADARSFGYRDLPDPRIGQDAIVIERAPGSAKQSALLALPPGLFASVAVLPPVALGRDGREEIVLRVLSARKLLAPVPQAVNGTGCPS